MADADDVSLWVTLLQPKDVMDSVSIGVQAQSEAAKLALDARVWYASESFDSLVNTGWVKKVSCLLRDYVNK